MVHEGWLRDWTLALGSILADPTDRVFPSLFLSFLPPHPSPRHACPLRPTAAAVYATFMAQGPLRPVPHSSRPSCTFPPNCAGFTGRAGAGCCRRGRRGRGGTGRRGDRRGARAPCPLPPRGTR